MTRKRRFWGWGYEDAGPDPAGLAAVEASLPGLLGMQGLEPQSSPRIEELSLRAPRVALPASLERLGKNDAFERAFHSYGKSYRDLARAFARSYPNPPDVVAFPSQESDVVELLDFCSDKNIAVIPFGGGSSVCGGVEPEVGERYAGTLSLDLSALSQVLEVDTVSRAARIQAGVLGPALEEQLKPHGLSLRHYPQSFEFSSLGGWIATRAGGHFATLHTHIDEQVESMRVVTGKGVLETRRLPGDGAGPSADRLFIGSEGALGIITEAWMRLFPRPRFRGRFSAGFPDFERGAVALRALAQSGLYPSNCRLLDPLEALMNVVGSGAEAVLLVAFESGDHPLDAALSRAAELVRDLGGRIDGEPKLSAQSGAREGAGGAWREAFVKAPYLRDELVSRGVFVETYETAVTWDRLGALYTAVRQAATDAAGSSGHKSLVSCRITHAYPDGAAPYFTVVTPAWRGSELRQWDEIKRAVTLSMLEQGGTVTHHHAVGRDFRPYYQRQRPELFARMLAAAKREVDPGGILNPGVLLDSDELGVEPTAT